MSRAAVEGRDRWYENGGDVMLGKRAMSIRAMFIGATAPFCGLMLVGTAQAAPAGYVGFAGSYTQDFSTLPYQVSVASIQAARSVTFSPNATIGTNVTYTIPNVIGQAFSLSDTGLNAGGIPIASGMDGWWGQLNLVAGRLGQNDGSYATSFSGGLISLGASGSASRSLGVVSSNTTGYTTAALALRNDSGSPITAVTISLEAQLWDQRTTQKYLNFSYAVAPGTSITGAAAGNATLPAGTTDANLSPAFATGTHQTSFAAPVSSVSLSDTLDLQGTPWGSGEILWLQWTTFAGGTFTPSGAGSLYGTATGGTANGASNAQQIGLSSLTVSVPEPSSVTLIALLPLLVLGCRLREA